MHNQEFVPLVENQLLLTRCEYDKLGSGLQCMTLELYDTTLGDNARDRRCVFALPDGSRVHLPKVSPRDFCACATSTFYK